MVSDCVRPWTFIFCAKLTRHARPCNGDAPITGGLPLRGYAGEVAGALLNRFRGPFGRGLMDSSASVSWRASQMLRAV